MPRYLFETRGRTAAQTKAALALVAARFPEIEVEHRYTGREAAEHEMWVCTAPSASHIARWAAAAEIELRALDQVDDEPHVPLATQRTNKEIQG